MKSIAHFLLLCTLLLPLASPADSVHDFTVEDIGGSATPLSQFKGKVLLIVNSASKCGFTKQYADLVALQKEYGAKGLVVIAFPANNFNNQEPGTNVEIQAFCQERYDVDFPVMAKISVRGDDQHPLFAHLTQAPNPDFTGDIRWNFEKFLVGPDGKLLRRFRSLTNPNGAEIRTAIEKALPPPAEAP